MMARRERPAWLVPVAAAVVAHALSLRNGFVLDDATLLVHNPYVRTGAGLGAMLEHSLFATAAQPIRTDYYRPLSSLLYWVSWHLFHASAPAQHALNVAMHAGVAALVVAVLLGEGVPRKAAVGAATLFAVHPATADIVAYVGGRQDMLGWLLLLGAWRLVRRLETAPAVMGAALAGITLSVFSREAFVIAAPALVLVAALRPADGRLDRRKAGLVAGAAVGAAALVFLVRKLVGVGLSMPSHGGSSDHWAEAFAGMTFRLLKDVVAPTDLVVDLTLPHVSVPGIVLSFLLLVASPVLVLRALRGKLAARRGLALGALALFWGTAAVHAPVALRFDFVSDRYAYGAVLAAALLGAPLAEAAYRSLAGARSDPSPLLRFLPSLPLAFAAVATPACWARVATWVNEPTLQRQMYLDRPEDPQSKFAEGSRLLTIGDVEHAYPLCKAYKDQLPSSGRADGCIASCLLRKGKTKEAIPYLRSYTYEHLADPATRRTYLAALFAAGDLDAVQAALDDWGPELASSPEVAQARRTLDKARHAPAPPAAP